MRLLAISLSVLLHSSCLRCKAALKQFTQKAQSIKITLTTAIYGIELIVCMKERKKGKFCAYIQHTDYLKLSFRIRYIFLGTTFYKT
jgi:predicted SPOUT superfamily RNA methylase MTH1